MMQHRKKQLHILANRLAHYNTIILISLLYLQVPLGGFVGKYVTVSAKVRRELEEEAEKDLE